MNDLELEASEPEADDLVVGVADGEDSEPPIAEWIRRFTRSQVPPRR